MSDYQKLLAACVEYRAKLDALERENAALREKISELEKAFAPNFVRELHIACLELERENAALRAELKRQRGLWQATYALGLAERDFAIKCIETALGPNKAQSWGDDQIMRQCLNEGGTPT